MTQEKYHQAMLRQHLAGVSPITPPDDPAGLIPKATTSATHKEQSEPLDLSKDKQKVAAMTALPPGMILTPQGGMLIPAGSLPSSKSPGWCTKLLRIISEVFLYILCLRITRHLIEPNVV